MSAVAKPGLNSLFAAAVVGHAGHRVPGAQRPGVAGGHLRNIVEDLRIEAEAIGQHSAFDDALQADREHHVVDDLRGLTCGVTAGVEDVTGHRLDDGRASSTSASVAAEHEGQGARLGAADSAGDGTVDEAESCLGRLGVEETSRIEVDRRGIDEQGLLVRVGQDAVGLEVERCGRAHPWAAL
jgi:hypothetical protein